ncbi:Phage lysin, 1,4-beta-N-acetylmuramidase or lysozyme |uniref:Phage lysin, 1,4-beta-N-acetylmuramidase or lysozyme \
MNISLFSGLKYKKLNFFLPVFLFLFIPFSVANAGILSFLGGLFDNSIVYEKKYVNSQTAMVLEAAVNVDPNPSKGGGDITIVGKSALLPELGPSGTLADMEESSYNNGQINVYVVREGDSISQIAKMFGVNTNTILWANDIGASDVIRAGQQLVILPVSGLEYTIRKGDTPARIAKKYKADVEDILDFNGIADESSLVAGEIIIIPGGKKSAPAYRSTKKIVRGSNAPSYSGYYIRPITGGRNSRATAKNPRGLHGYNAVDLAAPTGTTIVASASGRVVVSKNSGWNGGYGKYIVVEHPNGTQTVYAHQSGVIVKRGQWVVQGQVIGYVGSTGRSTGPHIHFEVRGAKNPF